MKLFLLLVATVFLQTTAHADCMGSGLFFWPQKQEVSANPIFMIEGHADSQKIIQSLKKHSAYLKAGDHVVYLKVLEKHKGNFTLTQAILQPEKPLKKGKTYTLFLTNSENELLSGCTRWNSATREMEPVRWTISETEDRTAPQFSAKPAFKDDSYQMYGCGPAIFSNFSLNVKDASPILVRTVLYDPESNTKITYYVPQGNETVTLGHGMCSGAFELELDHTYTVQFELLDASGNRSNQQNQIITFTSPSLKDKF